jgi:hypothetical protein
VGEIQAHHTGWVIQARLLARSGTILPDGDEALQGVDGRIPHVRPAGFPGARRAKL